MIKGNSLMNDIIKKYQLRVDAFQVKANKILNSTFNNHPELFEFRKKYAHLRNIERVSRDKKTIKEEYKKIHLKYEDQLKKYLIEDGIDPEHLKYKPLCAICNDTGYVGDKQKKYCSCIVAQAAQHMLEGSNINDHETIDSFNVKLFDDSKLVINNLTQRQLMQKLYNYITSWISAFPACDKRQLLISGNVGLGKSYCLNAIAYNVIKKGFSAMMITAFAINEAAFDEIKSSDSRALNMMRNVDLLLIDDLGSEQVLKNITCPTFFNILNERVRRNRHTIVSTNLSAEEIEIRYGSRVFSRLIDKNRTMIFPLMGKDIRSATP